MILPTVGPQEIGNSAIIIVATIQSFSIKEEKKYMRTVYSFDEALAPHFQGLTPQQENRLGKVTEADIAAQPYLTALILAASRHRWPTG
jgi:type III restriction enzyme